MKKRILYIEDIHTRLYNNFDDLEEKRRMKICNSMPSFKPLLNKSFKKATFQKKKIYNRNPSTFNKKLNYLLKSQLKNSRSINSHKPTKFTSRSFMNDSSLKTSKANYIINNIILKNIQNSRNKKSRYDEGYFKQPNTISNFKENKTLSKKSQSISNKSKFNKKEDIKQSNNIINIQNYKVNNRN